MRAKLGMPAKLGSCHTARVGGYVIEGHVPVREIRRLLHEQPKAIGLTVPGMVVGSPGMDGPSYKGRKEPYSVLLVNLNGESSIFQKYDALVNSAPTSKTKNLTTVWHSILDAMCVLILQKQFQASSQTSNFSKNKREPQA